MEPLLKTEKLAILFDKGKPNEYLALKDVSIEIFPNEYVIFFGPSGSGKSTLLYALLGLLKPYSGEIYAKGQPYSKFTEKEKNDRTARLFGIVFQSFNLLSSLNVLDNVMLPQIFIEEPQKTRKPKALVLLKRFGIEARAKVSPGMLSGGQQQRVAVCRALVNNPDIILADEPVGNLDAESARIVMQTLKDINKKDKKTVILVTHDSRYLPYADRIYFFKDTGIDHVEKRSGVDSISLEDDKKTESDLDRLARVHASLTTPELKAWSLSNWLTEELTSEQSNRLEKAMEKILAGKISPHQFYEELDRSYSEGGVGLYQQTAASFAKRVSHILHEMNLFAESVKHLDEPKKREHLIKMLSAFLLEEHRSDLPEEKLKVLGEAIEGRVMGKINHNDFIAKLSITPKGHGIGLKQIAVQRLAERLELIMSKTL